MDNKKQQNTEFGTPYQQQTLFKGHILIVIVLTFVVAQLLANCSVLIRQTSLVKLWVIGLVLSAILLLIRQRMSLQGVLIGSGLFLAGAEAMVWILAQLNVNLLVAGSFGLVMIAKSVLTRAYKESEARSAEQRAARLKQIEAASQNTAVQQKTTAVAPDTSEQIESNDIEEVIHEVEQDLEAEDKQLENVEIEEPEFEDEFSDL